MESFQKKKKKKQKVRFNIFVTSKDNIKITNEISNFISYDDIIMNIKNVLMKGHIPLVENMADQIAKKCLKDKRILKIKIKVEKLEPFKEAESVGVEIIRMNKK